jgi:hypothetical protein
MNEADTLAALADIELPAPPDWRPLIALAAALLIMTGALIAYIYIKKRIKKRRRRDAASLPLTPPLSPREKTSREALARLEGLRQEWSAGAIDARAAAYRLGTMLRLGLGLPQLHPAAPPAGLDTNEWRETLLLLQSLRYAPLPAQALTPDIFIRARHWLSQHETGGEARDV